MRFRVIEKKEENRGTSRKFKENKQKPVIFFACGNSSLATCVCIATFSMARLKSG